MIKLAICCKLITYKVCGQQAFLSILRVYKSPIILVGGGQLVYPDCQANLAPK